MSMDKGTTAYQQYLLDGLASMGGAADEINRLTAERIRRVPEPHFAKYLLNVVRLWVTKSPNAPEIGYWLNVADGLNNPMHVVDQNDQILFTVPPPFVDISLQTTYNPNERFESVYDVAALQGNVIDNGDLRRFWDLEGEIIEKNKARPEEKSMAVALTQLARMYMYYNLPLEELLGPAAEEIRALLLAEAASKTPPIEDSSNAIDEDPEAYSY